MDRPTSKFLSKSGYILPDIFTELRSKLLRPTSEEKHIEQVCFWSAELVCSGKVKQLASMLVDMYSTSFISKNLSFVTKFSNTLDLLIKERFNQKSSDVQSAICTLVLMLARSTPSRNPRSFATTLSSAHQSYIDGLQRPTNQASNQVLQSIGASFIDSDILHILINYWQALSDGDAGKACCITDYVTQKVKTVKDVVDISAGMPKAMQSDSVWVLWKILLDHATISNIQQKRLVEASFNIFKTEYTKVNRKDRLNVLYACIIVITTKKSITEQVQDDKVIVQALTQLDDIYRTITGKAKAKAGPVKQAKQSQQSIPQVNTDEKMQALFCYAYVKPAIHVEQRHRVAVQPQFKELDLQCGSWNPMANDGVTVQKLDAATSGTSRSSTANHVYRQS